MIILRKLQLWRDTASCHGCGARGAIRVMTINAESGDSRSLVLCTGCEASLANKLDKRKQAVAFKRLGIKSKPWTPDND